MTPDYAPKPPSWRSLAFVVGLIVGLIVYAGLVGLIADFFEGWPTAVEFVYYVVAGVIWIFPAKKALDWLNRAPNK